MITDSYQIIMGPNQRYKVMGGHKKEEYYETSKSK